MNSRVEYFRPAACASDGHQLTEEGSLGRETTQMKAQSCEQDEGITQAGAKGAHHTGAGEAARSGQAQGARTKPSDLQLL